MIFYIKYSELIIQLLVGQQLNLVFYIISAVTQSVSTDQKTTYMIRKKSAGIILIINQKIFHFDSNPDYKDYLPRRRLETVIVIILAIKIARHLLMYSET